MRKALPIALFGLAGLAAGLVASPSRAQPGAPPVGPDAAKPDAAKPDAAKPDPVKAAAQRLAELIKRGVEQCAAGDVDEGLPALRAAWTQHQDADLAIAVATCEIKASEWPSAAEHLAYALRNKDDPEQRKALEATFLNVRARVGAVKVTVTVDGADVFAGDRFTGQSPLPGEIFVAAGTSRVSAKKTGYGEIEGAVDVKPGGTTTLKLDLAGEGAVATGQRVTSSRSAAPAYVLGGIGAAALGVGAALYAAALSKGAAADDLLAELGTCAGGAPGCATVKSLRSGHDTYANAGTGLLAGGGALVGAAIVYGLWATFSTPPSRPASAARLTVVPTASPSGGGLGFHGTF